MNAHDEYRETPLGDHIEHLNDMFVRAHGDTEENIRKMFIKQAEHYGHDKQYSLDKEQFIDQPNACGCMQVSEGQWLVYNTDFNAKPIKKKQWSTPWKAYSDLARRMNFGLMPQYSPRPGRRFCWGDQ